MIRITEGIEVNLRKILSNFEQVINILPEL